MGGYTTRIVLALIWVVVICLQISNFEWVDTPLYSKYQMKNRCDLLTN